MDAHVSTKVEADQPIVCERAMYFDYYGIDGGSDSQGSLEPKTDWYLAEGCTREAPNKFDTFVLLMNPTDKAAEVTGTFTGTCMRGSGAGVVQQYTVGPHSRYTVRLNDIPGLGSADVSSRWTSTNGVPILCDRAMYFNYKGWTDGHASIGSPQAHNTWYIPEGFTSPTFDSWILVQNPNPQPVTVTARFMTPAGLAAERVYKMDAMSRLSVRVNDILPAESVSTEVVCNTRVGNEYLGVIVDGSEYFDFNGITGGNGAMGIGVDR